MKWDECARIHSIVAMPKSPSPESIINLLRYLSSPSPRILRLFSSLLLQSFKSFLYRANHILCLYIPFLPNIYILYHCSDILSKWV